MKNITLWQRLRQVSISTSLRLRISDGGTSDPDCQ